RAANFGEFSTGELSHARGLEKAVDDYSVTIFDRAYYSAAFLLDWEHSGTQRHWLMRARSGLKYEVLQELGPGD
ncbi:hypothetical protein QCD79_31750, partial [Pseudomonas quasicaspiana]|nr:hypothetical protein [Pseudomonas quasicaspiana]